MKRRAKIIGTGSYCPLKITNEIFINKYGKKAIAVSKLINNESRFMGVDINTGDIIVSNIEMAYEASISAINSAGISNKDIEMIIYSTATPDYLLPPSFTVLQEKLGIEKCIGFDIRSGCAGFGSALTLAETYILAGKVKNVLVVGSDIVSSRFSKFEQQYSEMPMKMLFNYMFFGDGAGAIILSTSENSDKGIIYSEMYSDNVMEEAGSYMEIGGSINPYPDDNIKREKWPIFQAAGLSDENLPLVLSNTLINLRDNIKFDLKSFDKYIMPVASKKILSKVCSKVPEIDKDKIFTSSNEGGALVNAAVPIAIDKAIKSNVIKSEDRILVYAAENTKWQHAVLVIDL